MLTKIKLTGILIIAYGIIIAYLVAMGWLLYNHPYYAIGLLVGCCLAIGVLIFLKR